MLIIDEILLIKNKLQKHFPESCQKAVLKNVKFARKHLCRIVFLIRLGIACIFIKKEAPALGVFVNSAKNFQNSLFYKIAVNGWLRW